MGRLIEQQTVIDCLTTTAKYYDMPQSDEWTKGIHYGLLHGVDNILDNVPTVDAIPKAEYENRLKADLEAILVDLQLDVEGQKFDTHMDKDVWNDAIRVCSELIQQKINELETKK